MKKIILLSSSLFLLTASAHTILGTPVLPGTLKTSILVNAVKTNCKVKVEKVRNLLFEDSYGNPGYTVRMNIDLSGDDLERKIKIRYDRDFTLTNMFQVGQTLEVRDYDYFSPEGATLKIKTDGRLHRVSFPFENTALTCSF